MVSCSCAFYTEERLTMIKVVALVIGVIGVTICLGLDRSLLGVGRVCRITWFTMLVM